MVTQSPNLSLATIAMAAALVAALALAGCGRKSGLDAPPMAAAPDQPALGQPGAAVTPQTDKRHSPLDWLID